MGARAYREPARTPRAQYRAALRVVSKKVGLDYGYCARAETKLARRARKLAAYLVHVELGYSQRAVARAMPRDHVVIARYCAEIEEWREDASFDAWMARLGRALRRKAGAVAA